MRAVVLDDDGLRVIERPAPVPLPGEVLVRVLYAGLCETDLQLVRGYMGFQGVLGHEFVGIAQSGRFQNQRVVGEINCACDACDDCRSGLRTHCSFRTVLGILNHDGAFADYVSVPERNLHRVPDEVSDRQAVFTEPLAAAFQILRQISLTPDQRVIILGDGRLGNLCAQVVAGTGCQLTVVGKHASKLDLLSGRGINSMKLDELNLARQADIVIDCTGSPTGFTTALQLLKPRGTLILKTTVAGTQTLSLAPVVIDEIQIVGSRCGPFIPALEALRAGSIQVEPLIEGIYPIADAVTAFDRATTAPTLKLLFDLS